MGAIIALILPLLMKLPGVAGDYFKSKADQIKIEQDYKLAALKSNTDIAIQALLSDTTQRANNLGATSQSFRQGTFYWMSGIILYSIICPSKAEALWHNFNLIPEWVRYIYLAMMSVTWGLPIAKENIGLMFSSIGRAIEAKREYKLEKARINRKVMFDTLRKNPLFKGQGINQSTVDAIEEALEAGENA